MPCRREAAGLPLSLSQRPDQVYSPHVRDTETIPDRESFEGRLSQEAHGYLVTSTALW